MTRILHRTPSPWPGGYSSPDVIGWAPGEERAVPSEVAAYLLATFPGIFAEVPAVTPPSTPSRAARR